MSDAIQQQLIAARKNQILDAAAAVFAEKGFHPTTTKDIAKQAGISEGTIYNYFDSKPALLLSIFERMKARVIQENMPPAPDELDFHTFLHTFLFHSLVTLRQDNFVLFRIVMSEIMVNEELRMRYYQQILEPTLSLAEGHLASQMAKRGYPSARVKLTIRAISGMVQGLILEYMMGDPTLQDHWEELPDFLTDLLLPGLENDQK